MRTSLRQCVLVFALFLAAVGSSCGGGGSGDAQGAGDASGAAPFGEARAETPAIPGYSNTAVGAVLATVRVQGSGGAGQNSAPLSFGQVFAPGALRPGEGVSARSASFGSFAMQVDPKALHSDGSIRHAVLSGVAPSGNPSGAMDLVKESAARSGSPPQAAALIASGFSARVDINSGGVVYSASPDATLQAGSARIWLQGPDVIEWQLSAPLRDSAGNAHPKLTARFGIRYFPALRAARLEVVIENSSNPLGPAPGDVDVDVRIVLAGATVYTQNGLRHYHRARWRSVSWWGQQANLTVVQDRLYLQAVRALPQYEPGLRIASSTLNELNVQWAGSRTGPMGTGLAEPSMPNTGGRPDIGLVPGWMVMALVSGDAQVMAMSLRTAELAGSYSIHYRDPRTDRPISILDYPYLSSIAPEGDTINPATGKSERLPSCAGGCSQATEADTAHQPAFSFLPYLLTGEFYHLEELQFWAMFNMFESNPAYRRYSLGLLDSYQVRGQAWSLRTLGEAAWITPDDDALKRHFGVVLANNLNWYRQQFVEGNSNQLGILSTSEAIVYDEETGIAPWQDDFFTQAVGRLDELGYTAARPLLLWKAQFPVSRLTDPAFCWIYASAYSLKVRDNNRAPIYASLPLVYQASVPKARRDLGCGSAAMGAAEEVPAGSMVYYPESPVGTPAIMQPALAYSINAGAPAGQAAWQQFMARSVKADYGTGPQFDIVPR